MCNNCNIIPPSQLTSLLVGDQGPAGPPGNDGAAGTPKTVTFVNDIRCEVAVETLTNPEAPNDLIFKVCMNKPTVWQSLSILGENYDVTALLEALTPGTSEVATSVRKDRQYTRSDEVSANLVRMKGIVGVGVIEDTNVQVHTLPEGFRPFEVQRFIVPLIADDYYSAIVTIQSNGNVFVQHTGTLPGDLAGVGKYISFDGITFEAQE